MEYRTNSAMAGANHLHMTCTCAYLEQSVARSHWPRIGSRSTLASHWLTLYTGLALAHTLHWPRIGSHSTLASHWLTLYTGLALAHTLHWPRIGSHSTLASHWLTLYTGPRIGSHSTLASHWLTLWPHIGSHSTLASHWLTLYTSLALTHTQRWPNKPSHSQFTATGAVLTDRLPPSSSPSSPPDLHRYHYVIDGKSRPADCGGHGWPVSAASYHLGHGCHSGQPGGCCDIPRPFQPNSSIASQGGTADFGTGVPRDGGSVSRP